MTSPRSSGPWSATQAGLTITPGVAGPADGLWYVSSSDYTAAILFNALMFAVASVGAQWSLRRDYRLLIAKNPRHRSLLWTWLVIYAFVGIQMGWDLASLRRRPRLPRPVLPRGRLEQRLYDRLQMIRRVSGL